MLHNSTNPLTIELLALRDAVDANTADSAKHLEASRAVHGLCARCIDEDRDPTPAEMAALKAKVNAGQ